MTPSGVHAERGGDELGVHSIDQVGEAGAAQHPGRDGARAQDVAGGQVCAGQLALR